MVPGHLVGLGIGLDVALEVDVVSLLNGIRIQFGAHSQADHGRIYKRRGEDQVIRELDENP